MVKKVLYSVIGVAALIFVSLLFIGNNLPQQKQTVATQQPAPVASTSAPVIDMQKVIAALTASTDSYSQLLATGKQVLVTTQYPNATAGLSALNDPNSAASKFSSFRTETCIKNDPSANAMNTYRSVSDQYTAAKVQSPDALDNWNYDTNTAVSDICAWASVAADWQISKVSSAQLKVAEQKVTTDLAQAHKDLSQITQ